MIYDKLEKLHIRAENAEEALREAVKLLSDCETVIYGACSGGSTCEGCAELKAFLDRYAPGR
jgi:hypothetical protein